MPSETCARCGRVVDIESDEFNAWEAIDGGASVVCEGCLTGEEINAIRQDDEAVIAEIERDQQVLDEIARLQEFDDA
jgi:hypothetical protein